MKKLTNNLITIKVLKRRDAAAFMVAFTVAFLLAQFASESGSGIVDMLNQRLNEGGYLNGNAITLNDVLFQPFLLFLVQLLLVEVVLQLFIRSRSFFDKK